MNHLPHAVIVSILPDTQRRAPDWKGAFDPVRLRRKKDEGQTRPSRHAVRTRWGAPAATARPMPLDLDLDHDQAFRAAHRPIRGPQPAVQNTAPARWNRRSRMRGSPPASLPEEPGEALDDLRADPGRGSRAGAKSGLRIVGRIARVKVEAGPGQGPTSPRAAVDRIGMASQSRSSLRWMTVVHLTNSSSFLPTDGHGGCEYDALSRAQFAQESSASP